MFRVRACWVSCVLVVAANTTAGAAAALAMCSARIRGKTVASNPDAVVPNRGRHADVNTFLAIGAVAVGGALGSVARYVVSSWFVNRLGPGFPWGTFAINVSGAFVVGIVLQLAATRAGFSPYLRLLLTTGILGGYTTFSTFAYETYALSADGFSFQSVAYAAGSVLAGVAAAYAGIILVRAAQP